MKLFHGSLDCVETPHILPKDCYRPLDFGIGFYTTSSFEQAHKWVNLRLARNPSVMKGFVITYDFDEETIETFGLCVKRFNGVSSDWLNFIAANRLNGNIEHSYDIVIGPVADDRVYRVVVQYENGDIDKETALKNLKTEVLCDQILFHTDKSLEYLKYIDTEVI